MLMSWAVKRMQSMAHGRIREMGRIYVLFAVYGSRYRAVTEPRGGGCDAVSHGCYMDWFVTTSLCTPLRWGPGRIVTQQDVDNERRIERLERKAAGMHARTSWHARTAVFVECYEIIQ